MMKTTTYLLLTLLGFFSDLNETQINMDVSLVYVHEQKVSFKSKFFQKMASLFKVKKLIEKDLTKGKIDNDSAKIPKSLKKNFKIDTTKVMNRFVWIISPKENVNDKVIVYLHGGAYHWNLTKYNWSFTKELLTKTRSTIVIPDYPLAPESDCEEVYEYMTELYKQLLSNYSSNNIILMGESAGGGLALGFSMYLRDSEMEQVDQLILLAPWLDVTMTNPDIAAIDKNDKILGINGLKMAGKAYAGNLDLKDYRVSPIYGELMDLPKISIFVGTHDLFMADSRKLKNRATKLDIPFNYFEYPKMFHIWILVKSLREAKFATAQISSLILGNSES